MISSFQAIFFYLCTPEKLNIFYHLPKLISE